MILQYFSNHVIANVVSSMTHVAVRVHCRSASIPSHLLIAKRLKFLQFVSETVFELEDAKLCVVHSEVRQKIIINVSQSCNQH